MSTIQQLVGVYDADGGTRGDAAYVFGRILGSAHCALSDITDAPLRRKPEWDAMVHRLDVPFMLLHRNEMDSETIRAVGDHPLALVLVRTDNGLDVLLDAAALEGLDGSVDAFEMAIREAAAERGLMFGVVRAASA
jgi:hypothetical protein